MDFLFLPLRMTILETAVLVEVAPDSPQGTTTVVPLTPEQLDALRDACPDEDGDLEEPWL